MLINLTFRSYVKNLCIWKKFVILPVLKGDNKSGQIVQLFAIFARKIVYLEYEGIITWNGVTEAGHLETFQVILFGNGLDFHYIYIVDGADTTTIVRISHRET